MHIPPPLPANIVIEPPDVERQPEPCESPVYHTSYIDEAQVVPFQIGNCEPFRFGFVFSPFLGPRIQYFGNESGNLKFQVKEIS